jgi:predicted nicotinamide N-methyase
MPQIADLSTRLSRHGQERQALIRSGKKTGGGEPHGDAAAFILANLQVMPAPSVPDIRLYTAHPGSGLWRLVGRGEEGEEPPYWAYRWAGGTVLARYILDHPDTVSRKRVLDLGAGCGIVGIAAMKSGAAGALAADIDENALVATRLNAALNAVEVETLLGDATAGEPPAVDLVAVGDLFYEPSLASRVTAFLDRCVSLGIAVLVGDPGRAFLPHALLLRIAEYPVADFGDGGTIERKPSAIFSFLGSGGGPATRMADPLAE